MLVSTYFQYFRKLRDGMNQNWVQFEGAFTKMVLILECCFYFHSDGVEFN